MFYFYLLSKVAGSLITNSMKYHPYILAYLLLYKK